MEVRRFSFKVGFVSVVAAMGVSETAVVSVVAGDVIGSSAFASFFCYLTVSLGSIQSCESHTSTLESCLLKKPITPPLWDGLVGLLAVAGAEVVRACALLAGGSWSGIGASADAVTAAASIGAL